MGFVIHKSTYFNQAFFSSLLYKIYTLFVFNFLNFGLCSPAKLFVSRDFFLLKPCSTKAPVASSR